ncbi:MAG: nucleoside-diphosphate kinase [Bacteroidota bacterium]|nr:nucleoside-diphosphate kinase [Candidatus Kapabacteria bacterium]MDW8220779.1 nucleoside-diphosphate kinase [Bacteroidota bacterium]
MERTLAICKPDAVRKNVVGEIITMISNAGFKIIGLKMLRLTKEQAGAFYAVHKERPFYEELVEFMCSGPVVVLALEKENAVADYRTLIGATDPAEAAEGTIRKRFAASKGENAVHGSDSVENGKYEVAFFFSEAEIAANVR